MIDTSDKLVTKKIRNASALLVLVLLCACSVHLNTENSLESWNQTASRQSIIDFVTAVRNRNGADYVPEEERKAVFDNDGTLWTEQPMYAQIFYAIYRAHEMVAEDPAIATEEPFKTVLSDDPKKIAALERNALLKISLDTQANMSNDEYRSSVRNWMKNARHPVTGRPFSEMTFQPMLELLDYLRANDFTIYIVSGGDVEFMRAWATDVYGIPPEQIIGSNFGLYFDVTEDGPTMMRKAAVLFNNDGANKPFNIQYLTGRRPIFAFGNSDGDQQMLQWTAAGTGKRFAGIVHHTDAERESAYDRKSPIGHLDAALDEAHTKGWTVVDMKTDWNTIYPAGK